MNMENFITGYPGHEHQARAALLNVLGREKYDFFFDKVGIPIPMIETNHLMSTGCAVFGTFLRRGRCQVLRFSRTQLHSVTCKSRLDYR